MREVLYGLLAKMTGRFGFGLARIPIWFVTTWIFLFKPEPRRHSMKAYQAVFPGRSRWVHLAYTWRQYHNFSELFLVRLIIKNGGELPLTTEGKRHLVRAKAKGRGGLLLMSHLGNWEMASTMLRELDFQLMLYLGEQQGERLEAVQKDDLANQGIKVVKLTAEDESPLDGLEALYWLRDGGFVGIGGDRLWTGERKATVRLFDHSLDLPVGAHALAMAAKVPIFIFFCVKEKNEYKIICSPPYLVQPKGRDDRRSALAGSVENYAARLEEIIKKYPDQWYIFEPFLGPKWED